MWYHCQKHNWEKWEQPCAECAKEPNPEEKKNKEPKPKDK